MEHISCETLSLYLKANPKLEKEFKEIPKTPFADKIKFIKFDSGNINFKVPGSLFKNLVNVEGIRCTQNYCKFTKEDLQQFKKLSFLQIKTIKCTDDELKTLHKALDGVKLEKLCIDKKTISNTLKEDLMKILGALIQYDIPKIDIDFGQIELILPKYFIQEEAS